MKKAKQVIWSLLATSTCMITINHTTLADSLPEQRTRYAQIKQAWNRKQMDTVQTLMPTLKDYPLYPYLEYRKISDDLINQPTNTVMHFIQTNPTLPLVHTLKSRFVNELARRRDWQGLLAFSPKKPSSIKAQCNYYYAKWITGQQDEAFAGAKELWLTGKNQPEACNSLFGKWRASGKQDSLTYLRRIRLAMDAGNKQLVITLARQMPTDYQTISAAVIQLANNPNTVLSFARATDITDFTRQMVASAFSSVVRNNVENARLMIPQLAQAQKLNDDQTQELRDIVAWKLMNNDVLDEQANWRDDAIMHSNSIPLVERRIRMALGIGDRQGLNTWLKRLPIEAKDKNEWRYWKADLLLEFGRKDEAKSLLYTLMQQRGFYPMVAAQRLGKEYTLKINKALHRINSSLVYEPTITRIHELVYWNLYNTARNEWSNLITNSTLDKKAKLARYAFDNHWWDLSVQTTIAGNLWDHLEERFPPAYRDLFQRYTSNKDIPQSYAMAIARQESAWNPKVRSPMGASGLMQIMPSTATYTVKMFNIPGYNCPSQLLDPEININIGTSYLQHIYQQFGNNRIITSAAYNAGPIRVRSWLGNSAGRIDAVAFVESIPFSETRSYVKNVLAYDVYYRYFLGQKNTLMSEEEWQRNY